MPVNPGERYPERSRSERATQVVRGSIFYFHPIFDALLLVLAVCLAVGGFAVPAVVVALLAGRISVR